MTDKPRLFTLSERPDLRADVEALSGKCWPRFLLHGSTPHWHVLFEDFACCQLLICDEKDRLLAAGHTIPLIWNGTALDLPSTIDGIIVRGIEAAGGVPDTLSALAAMVDPESRGRGLSIALVREMRALAGRMSCSRLVAPVRPVLKTLHPLADMDDYVTWRRDDGSLFDPWLRVHEEMGARFICNAPDTLTVSGTVGEWEEWTGMAFPCSGPQTVPGALQPVVIDKGRDTGVYHDPNCWMVHDL